MAKIYLWAADGCLISSITTLIDAFSIAELWHNSLGPDGCTPLFDTRIITTDGRPVTANGNIRIQADLAAGDISHADCVVISPILPKITPMPEDLPRLKSWLEQLKKKEPPLPRSAPGLFY
ncbi:MAG: hypothetical protein HUK40_17515 [Desulfobacter sp.]|nr:hypothetical protein [Desulfobacter sp.]WDP86886.1 MAG: hypothetical protein HUN05_18595 [Desulfobacter sp.]